MEPIHIVVDMRRTNPVETINLTQNDRGIFFIVKMQKNGKNEPLPSESTYTLTSLRPDGLAVLSEGELKGRNKLVFKIGTAELAVVGTVFASVQRHQADGRISSLPFSYNVVEDLAENLVLSETDGASIETKLRGNPLLINEVENANIAALDVEDNLKKVVEPQEKRESIEIIGRRAGMSAIEMPSDPDELRGVKGEAEQASVDLLSTRLVDILDQVSRAYQEIEQAITGVDSTIYQCLKDRLDTEQGSVNRKLNDIIQNTINVKSFGAKGDGITDDRSAIQSAINSIATTGKILYFPEGVYNLSDSVIINGGNDRAIILKGDSRKSVLNLTSKVAGKSIFVIKSILSYKNTYKLFEDLSFNATSSELQSVITWQPFSDTQEGTHAPFNFCKCDFITSGYNINWDNCRWTGQSSIRDCNGFGGGFIMIRPALKYYRGGSYPHSFSGLSVLDSHFSATGGLPRDSLLYLEGLQKSVFTNVQVEGAASHFSSQHVNDFLAKKRGNYLHTSQSSVTFNECWFESGGTDNVSSGYQYSFEGKGHSTDFQLVTFVNCKSFFKVYGKNTDVQSPATVIFLGMSYTSHLIYDISDGCSVSFDNCLFRYDRDITDLLSKNFRITIKNSRTSRGKTIGDNISIINSNSMRDLVVYSYTGGTIPNAISLMKSFPDYSMPRPHNSVRHGSTLKVISNLTSGIIIEPIFNDETLNRISDLITFPAEVTIRVYYRLHHHSIDRVKHPWKLSLQTFVAHSITDIIERTYSENAKRYFTVADFEPQYHYGGAEIKCIDMVIGKSLPPIHYGGTDCVYWDIGGENVMDKGTWGLGDKVKDISGSMYKLCTTAGTDASINITGNVMIGELTHLYVPKFDDFRGFIGGEFINVEGIKCRVLDYEYGTNDALNYLIVDKNLTVGDKQIVVNVLPNWKSLIE
ncbi:glycosyl hydrolase family 28-related protein [Sporosarcina sp. FSL K6-1522]|uniref:glycosyl hydrolase family 28-related protein n=1 Tax=Sporosarcina sp. FSL K6-1522 TaxID=2921554 RepID=UPI00315ACF01